MHVCLELVHEVFAVPRHVWPPSSMAQTPGQSAAILQRGLAGLSMQVWPVAQAAIPRLPHAAAATGAGLAGLAGLPEAVGFSFGWAFDGVYIILGMLTHVVRSHEPGCIVWPLTRHYISRTVHSVV